jgi:hypothetical protein
VFFYIIVSIHLINSNLVQVYWDHLWAGSKDSIIRFYLYSHVHKFGGLWQTAAFVADDQTCIFSVASDGSVRGGFPSVFSFGKNTPTESLLELFRVLEVTNELTEEGVPTARVTVSLSTDNFTDSYSLESFVSQNSVALHTIDSALVAVGNKDDAQKQGSVHVVAYGGAAGLVRIHSVNPFVELMHSSSR